jgi:hypothetical protein
MTSTDPGRLASQLDIERRFLRWQAEGADPGRAGRTGEWTLHLSGDLLVLNPVARRWLFCDVAHGGWADSGLGPGEAIFAPTNDGPGGRRALRLGEEQLPVDERVERVGERVLGVLDAQLVGPLERDELWALWSGRPGQPLVVFSPAAPFWQDGASYFGGAPAPAAGQGVGNRRAVPTSRSA